MQTVAATAVAVAGDGGGGSDDADCRRRHRRPSLSLKPTAAATPIVAVAAVFGVVVAAAADGDGGGGDGCGGGAAAARHCCQGKQLIKFIALDNAFPSDYEQAAAAGKQASVRDRPGTTDIGCDIWTLTDPISGSRFVTSERRRRNTG